MPWIAIPFGDARINTLKTKHNVTGIPKLVVLKANGDELVDNGRGDVTSNGVAAFDAWVAKL
jgi:nucleoredoxin